MLRPGQIRASAADAALMIPAARSLRPHYREITQPVVIMAGSDDRIVTIERQSRRLHAEVTGNLIQEVPRVGHMVHHTVPDDVLSAIRHAAELAPA
jgi:pimeloyl-ACP methyl ester carboxylesterase